MRAVAGASLVAALIAIAAATGIASTPYLGVDPGWAKPADVARALGEPVFKMGDILHEHRPQEGTGPIFVEYRLGSDVVDRVEVKLLQPVDRAAIVQALRLADKPSAVRMGSDGGLVELYGDGPAIGLAYAGTNVSGGVTSIGYYSDRLFDSELARATPASAGGTGGALPTPGGAVPSPPSAAQPVPATTPPSIKRDPAACYDVFLFADAQQLVAQRARQVARRQMAMDIRLKAQAGDCENARALADQYKKQFPTR